MFAIFIVCLTCYYGVIHLRNRNPIAEVELKCDSISISDSILDVVIEKKEFVKPTVKPINLDSLRKDSIELDKIQRDNFRKITRKINGGYNGIDDRLKLWENAKKAVK